MKNKNEQPWNLIGLAWDMGWLIALPLVGLSLAGKFMDGVFHTSPLFILVGVLTAVTLSSVLVYRKTTELLKRSEDESDDNPKSKI